MDLSVSEIKLSHKDIHGLCRLAIQEMSQRLFTNTNVERITFDAPERVEAKTLEGLKRYRAQNKPTRRRTLMFCHDEMRKRNEAAAAKRKDVELDDVPMDVMKLIARHI